MNILIVGCGQVGSCLATSLSKNGHDVSIIDKSDVGFNLLPNDFNGFVTTGVPIDQDVLRRAGIESCDCVAAVTPDDNVNIMISQLAKEIFHIKRIFTRIYDPKREEVFSDFGLNTICPTNLTVDAVVSALNDDREHKNLCFGTHSLAFNTMDIPKKLIGQKASDIKYEFNEILFAVERGNAFILVGLNDITLLKDDKLIFTKKID